MRLGPFFVATLVALAGQQAAPAAGQDSQFATVEVTVQEKRTGRVIDGLGARDFLIVDEGQQREVRFFNADAMPLDLVFLLYWKGALRSSLDIIRLQTGVRAALDQLSEGTRIAVLRGDLDLRHAMSPTQDRGELESALFRSDPAARWSAYQMDAPARVGDHLYDAVLTATGMFDSPRDEARRRAIVVITDDVERGSTARFDAVVEAAAKAGATVNAVAVVTYEPPDLRLGDAYNQFGLAGWWPARTTPTPADSVSVRPIVEATGGETIPGDKAPAGIPRMLSALRRCYRLGFSLTPSGQTRYSPAPAADTVVIHKIDVRLSDAAAKRYPDAVIRFRKKYYPTAGRSGALQGGPSR